jgi:serine kinase of HPr protein (carbohydrate metabolism regulator)
MAQLKSPKRIAMAMKNVFTLHPPVIIVTEAFHHKELLKKVASKYPTTVLSASMPSAELYVTVAA